VGDSGHVIFVRNSLTTSEVCAGALSWCNNQFPFFHIFHIFPQSSQNLTVKLPIDSLTRWYKLLIHNSSNVQKNDQHWLDVAANLALFSVVERMASSIA